jgi:hypothetical protein
MNPFCVFAAPWHLWYNLKAIFSWFYLTAVLKNGNEE